MKKLIAFLILKFTIIFAALFGMYLVCFHYGWGMDVHSWTWVFGCWWAALFAGGAFALPIWGTPKRMAVKTAIYLATVFCLSCWAIIYGWGMHPRNWWLVVIPYAIAGFMPPFNEISKHLFFWRGNVDPVMQALSDLHNAAEEYRHMSEESDYVGDSTHRQLVRALENARHVVDCGSV